MTSTVEGAATSRALHEGPAVPVERVRLTWLDLLAGGALLVVAVVAWASLVLAHVGAHSVPAVAAVSLVVLAVVAAAAAPLARRNDRARRPDPARRLDPARRTQPALRRDLPGVAVALGCAVLAAWLTFPGFSYGVADKDPGGYVSHAVAIAQNGDYSFVDPLLAAAADDPTFPVQLTSPGARFPGIWVREASTGTIVPQFYHLWPALLATSYAVAGQAGLLATVPLAGVLSVLALVALVRRVGDRLLGATGGLVAAGAAGVLLATNMLQVWQSRYPTTEVFAQALYLGALLGIVVALQTGWRPAAGFAGLLVGVGWLNRADGLLLVLLSVGLGAALLATRRWDTRATWFAAGLGVVAPHALVQAYDLGLNYSNANDIPPLWQVAAVTVACFGLALLLRLLPLHRVADSLTQRRVQLVLGLLVLAGAAVLMVLGYLRPRLFGEDFLDYNGRQIRSYDEQILARLTWFFSLPGFALMLAGLAVAALRRWSAAAWTVVLPTLLLFAVYGYTAKNSTRLLWWTRRYVPTVLPGIVILIALAIAFFVVWRFRGKLVTAVPAVLALVGLTTFFLSQSLPLRAHDEWRGSFEISGQIAALSGDRDGIYLWELDQGCCAGPTRLFATPVWLQHGQLSGLLAGNAAMKADGNARRTVLQRTAERFPDRPLFVVADNGELPDGIDPASVEPVLDLETTLPMWEESDLERPDEAREIPVHVSVWHVRGT
ncbi:MAG: hypothetical protein WD794_03215 [Mycobacteriales bacterium]